MQGRFGLRRIFGKREAAVLRIGALALIVLSIRRHATEDAISGESYDRTTSLPSEHVSDTFRSGAENTQQDYQEEAYRREELVERAQQIARGGTARRTPGREEADKVSSETEQEVQRYLEDIEYPASKDELVSTAKSNDAPRELIERLVGLSIREYSSAEEVTTAVNSVTGAVDKFRLDLGPSMR